MVTYDIVVFIVAAALTLSGIVQITLGQLELRDLRRKRLEREARRAKINAEHEANMRDVGRRVETVRTAAKA